jgi:hypothetical protein
MLETDGGHALPAAGWALYHRGTAWDIPRNTEGGGKRLEKDIL